MPVLSWKIRLNFVSKIFFVLFINLVVMSIFGPVTMHICTSDNSLYDIPHVPVHSQAISLNMLSGIQNGLIHLGHNFGTNHTAGRQTLPDLSQLKV